MKKNNLFLINQSRTALFEIPIASCQRHFQPCRSCVESLVVSLVPLHFVSTFFICRLTLLQSFNRIIQLNLVFLETGSVTSSVLLPFLETRLKDKNLFSVKDLLTLILTATRSNPR